MNTLAIFETDHPRRHLETLCRHFGKKVPVQVEAGKGWVQFSFGRCDLTVEQHHLSLRATARDQNRLDEVVKVMTSHLERFAFRENPCLEWRPPTT